MILITVNIVQSIIILWLVIEQKELNDFKRETFKIINKLGDVMLKK